MSELARLEHHYGYDVLCLDHPPANAINLPTAVAIRDALVTFRDSDVPALILTGAGDRFCGGLDLKAAPEYTDADRQRLLQTLGEVVYELYSCSRPVIAALNGHAVAAGSLMTLCCDYRIAPDTDCKFGFTGVRVNMPYPVTAMTIIRAELGASVARRLLLTGRTFDQDAALRDGIVDELVPHGSVMTRAVEVAVDLSSIPAPDYSRVKDQIRAATCGQLLDALVRDKAVSDGVWVAAS